jgi:hypothetical protein
LFEDLTLHALIPEERPGADRAYEDDGHDQTTEHGRRLRGGAIDPKRGEVRAELVGHENIQ